MSVEAQVADAVVTASKGADPLTSSLILVLGLILLVVLVARPVMGLVKQYRVDRNEGVKDEASAKAIAAQFEALQEQIQKSQDDIRELIKDKNSWQETALGYKEQVIELRGQIKVLEEAQDTVVRLAKKLDEKDAELAIERAENRKLTDQIMALKDRVHHLELRVERDEMAGTYVHDRD